MYGNIPGVYKFTLEPLSIMAWLIATTAAKTTANRERTTTIRVVVVVTVAERCPSNLLL